MIYSLYNWCISRRAFSKQETGNLQATALASIRERAGAKPYSSLGLGALRFAEAKLKEHPEITARKPIAVRDDMSWGRPVSYHQPTDSKIAHLTMLYEEIFVGKFKEVMKKNKENPWNQKEVLEVADACMKITYAISNLTLDDLEPFTKDLSSRRIHRTYAKALSSQDSYQFRTFYFCTQMYHCLRGGMEWKGVSGGRQGYLDYPTGRIPAAHTTLFYKKGTVQKTWNELYNNYCERVRLYVDEKELQKADSRHVNWTQEDTGVSSFTRIPDKLPT